MDPKKRRIQLKITPSSEGKEVAHPVQGTSDSMSRQGKKEQVKAIVKTKIGVTIEDASAPEKRQKTTEEPPPRVQSTSDGSVQAIVGSVVPENYAFRIKTSSEISEGKLPFISKTE